MKITNVKFLFTLFFCLLISNLSFGAKTKKNESKNENNKGETITDDKSSDVESKKKKKNKNNKGKKDGKNDENLTNNENKKENKEDGKLKDKKEDSEIDNKKNKNKKNKDKKENKDSTNIEEPKGNKSKDKQSTDKQSTEKKEEIEVENKNKKNKKDKNKKKSKDLDAPKSAIDEQKDGVGDNKINDEIKNDKDNRKKKRKNKNEKADKNDKSMISEETNKNELKDKNSNDELESDDTKARDKKNRNGKDKKNKKEKDKKTKNKKSSENIDELNDSDIDLDSLSYDSEVKDDSAGKKDKKNKDKKKINKNKKKDDVNIDVDVDNINADTDENVEEEENVKLYNKKDYIEIFANSLAKYTKNDNEDNKNRSKYKKYNDLSSYNYSVQDVKYSKSLVYRFDLMKPENKALLVRGREVTKFLLEGIKKWLNSDSNIPSLRQIYDQLEKFNIYIKNKNNEISAIISATDEKAVKDRFDIVIKSCNEISNMNYIDEINKSIEILKKDEDNIINENSEIIEGINFVSNLLQNKQNEYSRFVTNLKNDLENSCKKYFYNAKVNIYRPANKGLLQLIKNRISDSAKSLSDQIKLVTKNNNEIQMKFDEISNICKKLSTKVIPGELKAYTDEKLNNFITKKEFEERLLRPLSGDEIVEENVTLESFDPYDVSLMDVETNLIYTNITSFIYDYLTVCLIIPGKCFESGVQRRVCYLRFKDMINYLNNRSDAYYVSDDNEATGINLSKFIELKLKRDEVEIIKFGNKDVKDIFKTDSKDEYFSSDQAKQMIRKIKNSVELI